MFIKDGKRININAPYTTAEGVTHVNLLDPILREQEGVTEIAEPTPPEGYSAEFYFRTEQDDAPYVVYTRKSDEAIAAVRWEKIKGIRDNLLFNGGCKVLVEGVAKWFHSDVHSKVQQMSLVMTGENLPQNLQWKTMDGSFVTMTPAIATQLYQAQITKEMTIFAIAEAKRLDNSSLSEGWPEVFAHETLIQP